MSGDRPSARRTATGDLVRRYVEAFNARDHDAMIGLLHEDVAHDINENGREIGREKFRWFLAMAGKHYDERLADLVVMVNEDGSRAAAEFTVHGIYRATAEGLPEATGQRYTLAAGIFFEIDVADGGEALFTRVSTHYNLADWTRQVGGEGGRWR